MKVGYIAFISFALFSCASQNKNKIPYNADKIEVSAIYPDSALFTSVLTFLEQENFVVDKSDAKRGSIVTDFKSYAKNPAYSYRMVIGIKDQKILFRGEGDVQLLGSRARNLPLNYGVRSTNMQRRCFADLSQTAQRLARRLPGSTVQFKNGPVSYAVK